MRTRLRSKFTLLFIVCAALPAVGGTAMAITADPSGSTAPAPTIQSDKADYAPGELVTLTGSGWKPGESVNIKVNDTYGATWSRNVDVTANANGEITDSFNLPNSFVSDYDVTATGAQSGTATTTFTDGNLASVSGTVTDSATNLPISGATVTCNTSSGGNSTFTTTTDASGNYKFDNSNNKLAFAGNGPTTLTVSKSGYTTGTITLSNVSNGDELSGQNVALAPSCTAPSVTAQPSNQSITYGANAQFSAAANGSPTPTVQWQKSTDNGATWNPISGASSTTLTLTKPPVSDSGSKYRAVFTNGCGSATTNGAATLTVNPKPITGSFTADNKVYDGNNSATVLTRSLSGTITGDNVSLTGGTATFADKNVGNGKTVTLTGATLSGTDAGNYNLTSVSTTTAAIKAWNALDSGFYAPVGVDNSIFVAAPGTPPTVNGTGTWNTVKGGSIDLRVLQAPQVT